MMVNWISFRFWTVGQTSPWALRNCDCTNCILTFLNISTTTNLFYPFPVLNFQCSGFFLYRFKGWWFLIVISIFFYCPLFDPKQLCSNLLLLITWQTRYSFILAKLNYKLHSAFVNIPGKQFVGLLNGIIVRLWLVSTKAAAALLLPSVHNDQLYD